MIRRIACMPPTSLDMSLSNIYLGPLYTYLSKYGYELSQSDKDFFSLAWIFKEKKGLIHIHWPGSYYGSKFWPKFLLRASWFFSKLYLSKQIGYKLVWTVHNLYPHDAEEVKSILIHRILHRICRLLLAQLSDKLIVHSHYAKSIICKQFFVKSEKVIIIPHGSLVGWYPFSATNKIQAQHRLNLPEGAFIYLFFGKIEGYKGIDNLIDAFNKVSKKSDLLILAGKATETLRKSLLSRLSPNIIMELDFVDNLKLEFYIRAADVVVLPYQNILTSGAAITALSFGKVIIAPDISSISETLQSTLSVLYDSQSLASLEDALISVKKLDLNLGEEQALKKAATWEWNIIARETAQLFDSILEK